jgi:hypothetical protein
LTNTANGGRVAILAMLAIFEGGQPQEKIESKLLILLKVAKMAKFSPLGTFPLW